MAIQSYRDLDVYRLSYELAMKVYRASKSFPRDELYSLTDQIRRSARSVPANIAEGWGKRKYPADFKRHLWIASGSLHEANVWLDFVLDHGYLDGPLHRELQTDIDNVSKMLFSLAENWK